MKKNSIRNNFLQVFLKTDLFGEKAEISVDGSSTYPSFMGALISLAIIGLTLSYGSKKFAVMISYDDTNNEENILENALDS